MIDIEKGDKLNAHSEYTCKDSGNYACLDSAGCLIFLKISAGVVLEPGGKVVEACICAHVCIYVNK